MQKNILTLLNKYIHYKTAYLNSKSEWLTVNLVKMLYFLQTNRTAGPYFINIELTPFLNPHLVNLFLYTSAFMLVNWYHWEKYRFPKTSKDVKEEEIIIIKNHCILETAANNYF